MKGTGKQNPYANAAFDCYRNCDLTDIPDASFQALLGRKIPVHTWNRGAPLEMNDTVRQLSYAKNPLARLVYRILTKKVNRAIEEGKPDLNLLFIYNIPFRGMGKMMGGMVTADMSQDILLMCNGHGFRGIGQLIRHWLRKPGLKMDEAAEK